MCRVWVRGGSRSVNTRPEGGGKMRAAPDLGTVEAARHIAIHERVGPDDPRRV
jgi:hypothetical protein